MNTSNDPQEKVSDVGVEASSQKSDQLILERVRALREKMLRQKGLSPIVPFEATSPVQCGSWTHFSNG